jgi:O-antigen/teichoic acid export membrane protein
VINRKISFGVVAGGVSIAASSLSGLIIYPLLLRTLPKEVVGLWFFFTSFTVIINLGQAGLAPIVTRRAAEAIIDGRKSVLSDFYSLIKRSFLIVSVIVLVICVFLYFFYVHWVLLENIRFFKEGLIAWLFFVAGNLISIYNSKNIYIINGFGEVGWDKVIQILNSIFLIAGYFLILNMGYGLVGLSFVFFVSSLLFLVTSKQLVKKKISNEILSNGNSTKRKVVEIFKEGSQILVLNIVGILIMNKDIFLVERFLSLGTLPSFSALSRIQGIVMSISLLIPQMIFPFISQSYALGDFKNVKKMYWQGVIFSVVVALAISFILLIFSDIIFPLWLGKSNYLGGKILFLLLVMGFLSIQHNAHASAVISTGSNTFMFPAIINALLSLPMAYFGIKYFGIEGMILGNIIATILPSIYIVHYSVNYFAKLAK